MIIRISTEGQYEVDEADLPALNELDNKAVAGCDAGDEQQFHDAFARLLDFVRTNGKPVGDDRPGGLRSDPAAAGRVVRGGEGGVQRRGADSGVRYSQS